MRSSVLLSAFSPRYSAGAGLAAALALLAGCATSTPPEPQAVVTLRATQVEQPIPDKPVTGTIRLVQRSDGVVLRGTIDNLPPGSTHGIYIYENGDCSAPDGMSAGMHFNPTGKLHSFAGAGHAGDLPPVRAEWQTGQATLNYVASQITLSPGPRSVIGKAVIVHRDPDDPAFQPDGHAGPRLACGVIEPAAPAKK